MTNDLYPALFREAKDLCEAGSDTPQALLALTYAGYRAWAKAGNLSFPEEKHYALLQEILRYCAAECLLACCYPQEHRLQEIADMLDAMPERVQGYPHGGIAMAGLRTAPLP